MCLPYLLVPWSIDAMDDIVPQISTYLPTLTQPGVQIMPTISLRTSFSPEFFTHDRQKQNQVQTKSRLQGNLLKSIDNKPKARKEISSLFVLFLLSSIAATYEVPVVPETLSLLPS